jgi:hypothetical protein
VQQEPSGPDEAGGVQHNVVLRPCGLTMPALAAHLGSAAKGRTS